MNFAWVLFFLFIFALMIPVIIIASIIIKITWEGHTARNNDSPQNDVQEIA